MTETRRGRFHLVEKRGELAWPQEDYITKSTDGPFVDTDFDDNYGNRVNLSVKTVEELATLIGWVPGTEAAEAHAHAKIVESENAVLRGQYNQLVEPCRRVLDLQEYLQHSPEAKSRAAHPAGKSRKGDNGSGDEPGSDIAGL